MIELDIRTFYLSYLIINLANIVLITTLYFQLRKRYPETLIIFVSFLMMGLGNLLVFLRGYIPNWLSIPVANELLVASVIVLLIALERFVNQKGKHLHNVIILTVFILIFCYFTFISPNLYARLITLSLTYVLTGAQLMYLVFKRTPIKHRKLIQPIGIVFSAIVIFHVFRTYFLIQGEKPLTDYFMSRPSESIVLIFWQLVQALLAFTINLMYNKRLLLDVNAQEEKFSKAFHAAPIIMVLTTLNDNKIIEINQSILPIAGYHPKDVIGLSSTEVDFWANNDDYLNFKSELQVKGQVAEREYTFRKKSGELFPGLISAEIVEISNKPCCMLIIKDYTSIKKAQTELQTSEKNLRELNTTKDKFFSIIAHDLKNPFNGILGFSEIIRSRIKEKKYAEIDQYAEIIVKSAHSAVDLLSNLMEWTRAQTGRMEFNPEYIEMISLINSSINLLKTSALHKSIDITFDHKDHLIIWADKSMTETIIRNLLSNAIKFTHRGGTVTIKMEQENNNCKISVTDNGVGIAKEELSKLFRIEGASSSSGTENETGTGLGLILCKDFIEMHKGTIGGESTPGTGSTFSVSFPNHKDSYIATANL